MSGIDNANTPHKTLGAGVQATHIGPETGDTGIATAGGESGAGTSGQSVPAPASGLSDTSVIPGAGGGREERSFTPAPGAKRAASGPIAEDSDGVERVADGKERLGHDHHKHD
jgi:hypothetical protein